MTICWKPSAARITEHGNIVRFGPKDEDNYISNSRTEEEDEESEDGHPGEVQHEGRRHSRIEWASTQEAIH